VKDKTNEKLVANAYKKIVKKRKKLCRANRRGKVGKKVNGGEWCEHSETGSKNSGEKNREYSHAH